MANYVTSFLRINESVSKNVNTTPQVNNEIMCNVIETPLTILFKLG